MSRWIAVLVTLLVFAVSGLWAQDPPFQASLAFIPYSGDLPLYTTCDGTTPIPDGRLVKIFQDVDDDGPDDTDPQPIVCDAPPECEYGPPGTHNYNQFTLNGMEIMEAEGYFWVELDFRSVNTMPPGLPKYYLRVYEPDGVTVLWTSTVKTMTQGPQERIWTRAEWTCGAGGPQCIVRDEQE